jgi:hypothetical protein
MPLMGNEKSDGKKNGPGGFKIYFSYKNINTGIEGNGRPWTYWVPYSVLFLQL